MDPVAAWAAAAVSLLGGVLVVRRTAQVRIGCLLVAHGVCFGGLLAFSGTSSGRSGMVADQLGAGSWVFLFLWLVLVAYLVPDGRFLSTRWRTWVQVGLVGVAAFLVGSAGDSAGFRREHHGVGPPLPWLPAPVSGLLGVAGLLLTVGLVSGAALAVRARLRRSSGDVRLQLLWLVWGATSLPAALALVWVGHFGLHDSAVVVDGALLLAGAALPVTIAIAILRHRLFDIQGVLSRTLTYGALLAGVLAVYALLLLAAGRLLGASTIGGLAAVATVAVMVQPVCSFLQRRIERWVYGDRSDPAVALRRLSSRVDSADPFCLLETIAASVAEALKVERVSVEDVAPGTQDAPSDEPGVVRAPLVHRGERIGTLAVEVPPGRSLSGRDTALLQDLAHQAAVTVRAAQLARELQASRSRLVRAREEERKRLRRDLHDGVGPALAAVVLKLNAAQRQRGEAERNALLAEIRAETQGAITELRRLVNDLRPPAIDEVGLAQALRQRAASLSSGALVYQVAAPAALPQLPAAVEVAAFRIASEAMTNVALHSGASRCRVELTVDGSLGLAVSDNGRGAGGSTRRGVGSGSMVERAAELGGTCTIAARPEGGMLVRADLPLPSDAAREVAHDPTGRG
jgi:signal transduction histidine kinase